MNQQHQWFIEELTAGSAGEQVGLRVGDMIKEVNHTAPERFEQIQKWAGLEQTRQLSIIRDGVEHHFDINKPGSVNFDITPFIQETLWMLMALLLYVKLGRSPSARLLSFVFASGGWVWMSIGASIRGDVVGKGLIATFMMLMPVIIYHFLVTFFKEKHGLVFPKIFLPYVYTGVLTVSFLEFLITLSPWAHRFYRINGNTILIVFTLGFLGNLVFLIGLFIKYRREQSQLASTVRNIWLVILCSMMPTIVFSFLPQILWGTSSAFHNHTSAFLLLFPLYFAYLLSSNQIFNIGLVLRRFAFATVVAVVPSAALAAVYAFVFQSEDNLRHLLFIFFGSVFLISLILYSIEYVTTRLESFFFPKKFLLNAALKNIAKKLGAISSFRELKELVLIDIVETLETVGGAIIFKYNDGMREIIQTGDMDETGLLDAPDSLAAFPLYSCLPIHHHEEYRSFLVLGPKKTNALLGKEERQWLQLIISYLAVSLENLHLIRKQAAKLKELSAQLPDEQSAQDIQWFRKLMFELQEEERARIASDLHDTTMQDLFFLKQRFSTIADKYAWSADDRRQIKSIINFVEMINVGLRQSCFDLHPYLLKECGLVQTVDLFVEKESVDSPFAIDFAAEHIDAIEALELGAKTHLFRIVQELLNNARKHSQATAVRLRLDVAESYCRLSYEDDGVGFAEPDADAAAEAAKGIRLSGQGLAQMKTRVLHVNGQFELSSQAGSGTTLTISIPLKTDRHAANAAASV
ncbi:hypothetical protein B5M42_012395 [Paenibacillus athensensis]|nr:ATP-binding protein [Paenibacillus athensensis]MCD1259632.1 hypothetical protein [Paenibacillus athensensis]